MRKREAIGKRYAKALLTLAQAAGTGEAAGKELGEFLGVVDAHRELRESLLRPWVKASDRRRAAEAVAERIGCAVAVRNLVGLLAERGRMGHLREINQAYGRLVDEAAGRLRARVRTAVPIVEAERRGIAEGLSAVTGKTVVMEDVEDPALLGGFVAEIGSLVLDGSLAGHLHRLHERLVRG